MVALGQTEYTFGKNMYYNSVHVITKYKTHPSGHQHIKKNLNVSKDEWDAKYILQTYITCRKNMEVPPWIFIAKMSFILPVEGLQISHLFHPKSIR